MQLRHEQVLGSHDPHRHRLDLELLAALDHLVGDLEPRRAEDQVDHHVPVVRLEQPLLGRALGSEAGGRQHGERLFGVLGLDQEVEVVVGRRAAAHPGRDAAGDEEGNAAVAQSRRGTLQRRDHAVERVVYGGHARRVPGPERHVTARVWAPLLRAERPADPDRRRRRHPRVARRRGSSVTSAFASLGRCGRPRPARGRPDHVRRPGGGGGARGRLQGLGDPGLRGARQPRLAPEPDTRSRRRPDRRRRPGARAELGAVRRPRAAGRCRRAEGVRRRFPRPGAAGLRRAAAARRCTPRRPRTSPPSSAS